MCLVQNIALNISKLGHGHALMIGSSTDVQTSAKSVVSMEAVTGQLR